MPSFREVQNTLCCAFEENALEAEEFVLLYDAFKPANKEYSYDIYEDFDLDKYNDDECENNFRFKKDHIFELREAFEIPEEIACYNGVKIDEIEAFCIDFVYKCLK